MSLWQIRKGGGIMTGTVKQFKDTLEIMGSIYPFEEDKTKMQTRDICSLDHNHLSIITQDEKTGVWIEMSRDLVKE
jgi:hypothetical protein